MSRLCRILLASVCLAGPATLPATTGDDPLAEDRARFQDALAALDRGRTGEYRKLARKLKRYPLYPYLEYNELRKRLSKADPGDVTHFIKRYENTSVGERMRRIWLYQLANQRKWKEFLSIYAGDQSTRLQCHRLHALLQTGQAEDIEQEALDLWMVGHSQDKACNPVFEHLEKQDAITDDLVWQRIRLAMQEGHPSLAKYLAKRLPAADRVWVNTWRDARLRPASTLASKRMAADVPIAREIAIYAVQRIARGDVDEAHEKWQSVKSRYEFEPAQIAKIERHIALRAAWRRHLQAHEWLAALPDLAVDSEVREWRARTAIAAGLWDALLKHIADMSPEVAQAEEWRYWEARAHAESGNSLQASDRYARLARERDYHGFMAADELKWPYEMDNRQLDVAEQDIEALMERADIMRVRELYRAEMLLDARREWQFAIKDMHKEEIKQAAALANRWGWHDMAILTVARAREFNDLKLRFPLAHMDRVERYAQRNRLDPGHVLAVIRQESAFNPEARSHAGARGLMQLMPSTGRITARKYSIPLGGLHKLYEADKNISIGTAYLNQVMEDYQRNIVLASAAYNAGPHRVKRWLPEEGSQLAEQWVANVPFDETRNYIQRILAYSAIYDWRMDRPVTTLDEQMPDIYPNEHYKQ